MKALVLLALSSPAAACTACMGQAGDNRGFFDGLWWGIVLLLSTTMLLVGGIVWALRTVEKARGEAEA